jgi:IS30 family transposase
MRKSIQEIAELLHRHRSTTYQKIKRNGYSKRYWTDTLHKKYKQRRKAKAKNNNKVM